VAMHQALLAHQFDSLYHIKLQKSSRVVNKVVKNLTEIMKNLTKKLL
jgi:hypothetical protein